jgi:hypothetical protein
MTAISSGAKDLIGERKSSNNDARGDDTNFEGTSTKVRRRLGCEKVIGMMLRMTVLRSVI